MRPFIWGREVVLVHADVGKDVVVYVRVFPRPEVPRLLLRVVLVRLEALEFVFEVDHVVCLLISKSSIFILSQHVLHSAVFPLFQSNLRCYVRELLGYWVILSLHVLHLFMRYSRVSSGHPRPVCPARLVSG